MITGPNRHIGFATGLAYALAQCASRDDMLTVDIPIEEKFDPLLWAAAIAYLNEEAQLFYYKLRRNAKAGYWHLTLAHTEGNRPFTPNEDWL